MTSLCVDPVTLGFDITLADYVAAVGGAGFLTAEWPVIWAEAGPAGDFSPTRDAFIDAGVAPIQFTNGLGVPGNMSMATDTFGHRLSEFRDHCRTARAVGCTRASTFLDDCDHGGVALSEDEIVDRVAALAAVAGVHGVAVVVGWHGLRLLELCGRVYQASGGVFGLIIDTFTLARHGLGPAFIRTLPAGSIGWVRVGDAVAADGFTRRLLPGTGTVDIEGIVQACRDNGYDGPLSLEVNDAPPGMGAVAKARRAFRSLESVSP